MEPRGCRVTKRKGRDHWGAICEEWGVLVSRYSRVMKEDSCYWYNEMADVSILAAAAWRAGWIAISEAQTLKTKHDNAEARGRSDLYIANDYAEEYIEAKKKIISFDNRIDPEELYNQTVERAVDDALATSGGSDVESTGVCFVTPFLSKRSSNRDTGMENIGSTIEYFIRSKARFVSWCFPEETLRLTGDDGRIWPGVILVGVNPQYYSSK